MASSSSTLLLLLGPLILSLINSSSCLLVQGFTVLSSSLPHPSSSSYRRTILPTSARSISTTCIHQTNNNNANDSDEGLTSFYSSSSSSRTRHPTPMVASSRSTGVVSVPQKPSTSSTTTSKLLLQQQQYQLTPLELWCTSSMEEWYSQSLSIKCPFFRRRTADLLDGLDMVMRFLIIRHKSLDIIGPPPGCRCSKASSRIPKLSNIPIEHILELIRYDWIGSGSSPTTTNQHHQHRHPHKGYYITGRLNPAIYRDDCWFDGPDPDMPVRGLRKYINAASHLFDHKTSTAELLDLTLGTTTTSSNSDSDSSSSSSPRTIVATWRLQGVLHLPWKPKLPTWTGTTTYYLDEDGLIYLHEETWDISVIQAFAETLWPEAAHVVYGDKTTTSTVTSATTTTTTQTQ